MYKAKRRTLQLNAQLAQTLTEKGVEATADETTTALVDKVIDIPSPKEEQKKTVEITENGITEIIPDENKVFSKVTVNTDVVDSFYDTFWDNYQKNGKRTIYHNAFYGEGWTIDNFYPKYNITPLQAENLFRFSSGLNIDLSQRLKDCKIILDLSNLTVWQYTFAGSAVTRLPSINVSKCKSLLNIFASCVQLITIDLLIINSQTRINSSFSGCSKLKNITIEGEIGSTFDIKSSPLTVESAKSILMHLVNYAGTENEFVYSVLFADSVWELLNAEGATAPGDITWEEYVNSIGWNK